MFNRCASISLFLLPFFFLLFFFLFPLPDAIYILQKCGTITRFTWRCRAARRTLTWAVFVQPSPISSEYTRRTNWVVVRRATWVYPGLTRFPVSPTRRLRPSPFLPKHPPLDLYERSILEPQSDTRHLELQFSPSLNSTVLIVLSLIKIPTYE